MALKSEVETLQRRLQEHTDFVEAIRNAPDDEVLTIVRRLRSTESFPAAMSLYQGRIGGPSLLSEHASARAVMPWIETGTELDLVMLHPTTYPILEPPSPSSIASASLLGGSTQSTSSSRTPMSPSEPSAYCDPFCRPTTLYSVSSTLIFFFATWSGKARTSAHPSCSILLCRLPAYVYQLHSPQTRFDQRSNRIAPWICESPPSSPSSQKKPSSSGMPNVRPIRSRPWLPSTAFLWRLVGVVGLSLG
jgi:hypothetical protein